MPAVASRPALQTVRIRSAPRQLRPAVIADRAAGGHVLLEDRERLGLPVVRREHPLDRPAQVDRGRPRGGDPLGVRVVARQQYAERSGHAKRGGAADGQPLDRVHHLVGGGEVQDPDLGGQQRLIDDLDRVARPGHRRPHAPQVASSTSCVFGLVSVPLVTVMASTRKDSPATISPGYR